jgi:hypothetical protein
MACVARAQLHGRRVCRLVAVGRPSCPCHCRCHRGLLCPPDFRVARRPTRRTGYRMERDKGVVCLPGSNRRAVCGHAGDRIVPLGASLLGSAVRDARGECAPYWWKRPPRRRMPFDASADVSMVSCAGLPGAPGGPLLPSRPRFEVRHAPLKIIRLAASREETFAGVQGLFSSKGAGVLL